MIWIPCQSGDGQADCTKRTYLLECRSFFGEQDVGSGC